MVKSLAVASMLFGRHIRNGPDLPGKMPETARKMRALPNALSGEAQKVVRLSEPFSMRHPP